jgi:type I restriction enzyme S subunit
MEQWKEYKETEFGKIPNSWDVATIKEETKVVVDYVANGSFASLAENVKYKTEEDYAVLIRLVDYNNNYNGNFVFIDKEAYEFLGKSKLFGDEIIISNVGANVGTVFKCPRLKYKMSLAPNSIMVKFKGNNDFYYYWLKSPFGQHMLHSIVTGSAQPKFNKTNFREMSIPVPPIEIQEKIAQLLKPLDEKIEVNKQINSNLECSTSISPDISLGRRVSRIDARQYVCFCVTSIWSNNGFDNL